MNTNLISFKYNSNIIRTQVDANGEIFFCANDICTALGYANPRKAIADHVDEGDVTKRDTPTTSANQMMTYINESGLYALIFGSKLDSAKQFKHWVTSEVLPSLRKTGEYKMNQDEKTTEDEEPSYRKVDSQVVGEALTKLLDNLKVTGSKRVLAANDFIDDCFHVNFLKVSKLNLSINPTVVEDVPRYTPTELGKPYGLSAQKINKLLEQAGLQYKEGTGWIPTEEGKLQGGVLLSLDGHLAAGSNISQLKWPITVINLIINNSEH